MYECIYSWFIRISRQWESLTMGRSPCCDESGLKKGPWTPEEDEILVNYIKKHGHGSWRALPKLAGTHLLSPPKFCSQVTSNTFRIAYWDGSVKGAIRAVISLEWLFTYYFSGVYWPSSGSADRPSVLWVFIHYVGWLMMANGYAYLSGLNRCGKSCRLRWTNYLRPDIKRGKFLPEEENTILNLHAVLGNK